MAPPFGSDQLAKQLLALDKRGFAQIVAVEIKAIEGVIGEPIDAVRR